MRVSLRSFLPVVALVLAGCQDRQPVSGEVRLPDGSPLPVGQVVFESRELKCGGACQLQPNGTFFIAQPLRKGEYVVYFTEAQKVLNAAAGEFGPVLVDEKFTAPETTPLRARVGDGPILLTVPPAEAGKAQKKK